MLDTKEMDRLTKDLGSKSEKMRVLAKAGVAKADIARYLGTRYQFVRNVLVREEERLTPAKPEGAKSASEPPKSHSNRIRLGPSGQIALPEAIRQSLGLKDGDTLVVTVEDDEIRLMTIPVAVRKAQAIVRQFVPEGISLVDELLEDRRREFQRERQE